MRLLSNTDTVNVRWTSGATAAWSVSDLLAQANSRGYTSFFTRYNYENQPYIVFCSPTLVDGNLYILDYINSGSNHQIGFYGNSYYGYLVQSNSSGTALSNAGGMTLSDTTYYSRSYKYYNQSNTENPSGAEIVFATTAQYTKIYCNDQDITPAPPVSLKLAKNTDTFRIINSGGSYYREFSYNDLISFAQSKGYNSFLLGSGYRDIGYQLYLLNVQLNANNDIYIGYFDLSGQRMGAYNVSGVSTTIWVTNSSSQIVALSGGSPDWSNKTYLGRIYNSVGVTTSKDCYFGTSLRYNKIYLNEQDITPEPLYTWQLVESISGKMGIFNLAETDSEVIGDGSPKSNLSLSDFTYLPDNMRVKALANQ